MNTIHEEDHSKLYPTKEAAEYLGVPSKSLYSAVYRGELERVLQGGNQFFTQEALDAYKERREGQDTAEQGSVLPSPVQDEEKPCEAAAPEKPAISDALLAVKVLVETAEREERRARRLFAALTTIRATIDAALAEYEGTESEEKP